MARERGTSIDEGRIKSGPFKGAKIVCRTYEKQGVIGFEIDDPDKIARTKKALDDYVEAYRQDQMQPRTDLLNPRDWYEPVFDSLI